MERWRITDMTHNNALTTNAMLASYASEQNISYLQMIEPFVIQSINSRPREEIDIFDVVKTMFEDFGIRIEAKVIEKVLMNISKNETNTLRCLKDKGKYKYSVIKNPDKSEFEKKLNYIKQIITDVTVRLCDFINQENILSKISQKDAERILVNFLEEYNAKAYGSIDNVEKIQTDKKTSSDNFKVAKFILAEHRSSIGCFDKIRKLQEGYFASSALYNFFKEDNTEDTIILSDKSIILDTMLLVDAFGLDTEYRKESMRELLLLIKKSGGKIYTFDYYVEEMIGIIEKYISDSSSRIYLDLDFYRRNKTNTAQISLWIYNIQKEIKEESKITLPEYDIEISVLYLQSYKELIEEQKWHIDRTLLEGIVYSQINYKSGLSDSRFINDCNSIEFVLYEKEIRNNNNIFLSSNSKLIYSAKKFCRNGNSMLFYSDMDLASVIWLSCYNEKSKLSELLLLQNAYAALSPTKEILDEVLRIIDSNIKSPDEVLKRNSMLLRYDENLLYRISRITKNDRDSISDDMQNILFDDFNRDVENRMLPDIQNKVQNEYSEKNSELNIKEGKLNKKQEKIESKERKVLQKEIDINNKEESLKTEYSSFKTKAKEFDRIICNEKDKCNKKSNILSFMILGLCVIITFLICSFVFYYLLLFCFNSIVNGNMNSNIYQIISLIFSIITLLSIIIVLKKVIKKLRVKVYDKLYIYYFNHSAILNNKKNS